MTSDITKHCQLFAVGTLLTLCGLFGSSVEAQCDFINDITGIVQGTLPVGNAANPALYTHIYVLVDNQGNIFATNNTPDFIGVPAGFYNLYAVNYSNAEAAAVLPLLAAGQAWFNVETYGNDDANFCLDYSLPYGSGCPIVVCDALTICEVDTLNNPAIAYNVTNHSQTYCLVCNDLIVGMESTGIFPLQDYPRAITGANCQLFGVNFNTVNGNPLAVGDIWTTTMDAECANNCIDFIGMDLNITPISQPSGNGISTTVDWWTTSGGCVGAQTATNEGEPFSEWVDNTCVPSYNPAPINARPVGGGDHLQQYAVSISHGRFACSGGMDLTQQPIFYTVECDSGGASILNVAVSNAGANISRVEAALYGPVDPSCPSFTGGTFVDCNDAGNNAISGLPMGDIMLTTAANPGEVYLVIVDTEGADQFRISSTTILLSTHLVAFEGHKEEQNNLLTWEVANEEDTDYYVLERSINGIDFSELSILPVHITSLSPTNYEYRDLLPGLGTKYYRLRTVYKDGQFEYSKVVALFREGDGLGTVRVYPNPVNNTFYAEFYASSTTELAYEIQDIVGQLIKKGTRETSLGVNKIELSLEDLPSATYVISLTLNGRRIQRKLIKQ
ncbi:T9SS type A sorting domain-containing protein [Aureispira anguillae]|uniref:T9SS type A sorting domain-containing protein n=1 Tax=Aureispira anguillae TaxID=2864201 RepID=A0A915YEY9_9BACT|nr:T9SS type A sorting domain-containing protein [Aureispira anguillae]BDS11805.1 T9SS type A sorting domain-containing protein [Aureispira anguillae]